MRTRLSSGEKPKHKRMVALITVYDAKPAERHPHDVIAPPGGRTGTRALRPGPKALAKWLAGSVRKAPAAVVAAASTRRKPVTLITCGPGLSWSTAPITSSP
jgi:hypothetical protein